MFEQINIFGDTERITVVPVDEKHTYTEYYSTEPKPKTQCKALLEYLETGHGITGLGALRMFGIMRLPARIADLKNQGHNITGKMVDVKNRNGDIVRVKKYWLENCG